ncbi:MAG: tetratricopeptide repeat protein [Candidatus Caenarcaniphilales bacterium]|nr:tetratricopeptide repeat protein [Candidatus Caenarcaniphilales bacterium]
MIQNQNSPSPDYIQWANRGVDLANQGDYAAAVEALYEAWKLNPDKTNSIAESLSSAYNNYGKQLAERGKDPEAILMLRRAVFFKEENKVPAGNLDILLKKKGINPNDYTARLNEARKLRQEGYVDESVAEYLKAVELAKAGSKELAQAKLELAQIYQVIFSKYSQTPVGTIRFDQMAILAKELINSNPKDPKPHILFGRAYLKKDKYPEAIDSFEKALAANSKEREALEGLVSAWRKVEEIAPKEVDNLIGLGNSLLRAGYSQEATTYLQKAKALDPNNKDIDKVMASTKATEEQAELYRVAERGLKAQQEGKYDQAIDLYQIALRKLPPGPESSNIYYNLGAAYQAKGQTTEAINAYNQAVKFNPTNDDAKKAIEKINKQALAQRAKLAEDAVKLQSEGKLNEAVNLYKKVLQDNPNDAQSHFNLGTAYQEQNKFEEALQQYQTATRLDPKNQDFKNAYNTMYEAMKSGVFQAAKATDVLKQAVNLQQAGKITDAVNKYKEAISIDPNNAQTYFNLATALHSINRAPEAIDNYKKAYKLDPTGYTEANFFVANLLENEKKYSEASAYYKRYLEDQPNAQYSKEANERIKALSEAGV